MTSMNDKSDFKYTQHFKRASPMKKATLDHIPARTIPVKPSKYKNIQPQLNLKWWDVFDALRGTGVKQRKATESAKPTRAMQIRTLQPERFVKSFDQVGHPNAHKLRMATKVSPFKMERSHTSSSNHLAGKTSFEIERPQTHGTNRLIINITTSLIRNRPKYSAMSQDRDSKKLPSLPRVTSNRSTRTPEIKFLTSGMTLPRGSTYKKSKVEQMIPAAPVNLSSEQKLWIADWIQSTNKAIESDDEIERDQLPIICEH